MQFTMNNYVLKSPTAKIEDQDACMYTYLFIINFVNKKTAPAKHIATVLPYTYKHTHN